MPDAVHNQSVLIVAEVGMNHDGSFGNACRLVDAAVECGADVVKFQTHIADAETLPDAPSPPYFSQESRYEYFKRTTFTLEQWLALKRNAEARGVRFLSSVFSCEAVDLLEQIDAEAYKIPSGEVTNLPLIEYVAKTGKPIYLSSGMSSWTELDEAVNTIVRYHNRLTVLQCTSEYPCAYEHVGPNVLLEMKARYKVPVGLSDHTLTNYAAFAAVALGAEIIEKHFTLSRHMYGSDAKHSLEPDEFADLVRGIRAIEAMLTNPVDKNDLSRFKEMKTVFEKSLVAKCDLPAGSHLTPETICLKKPGIGIGALRYREVLGRRVKRLIPANTLLTESDIEWDADAEA